MTSEAAKARDEHLIAALVVVLVAGHAIEREDVRLYREDNGRFVVRIRVDQFTYNIEFFDEAHDAAALYLDLCEAAPLR